MPTATRLRALLPRMVMAIVTNLVPTLFAVVGGLYLLLGIAELVGATEWFFNEPAGTSITFADLLLPLLGVALVGIAVGLKQRRRDIWLLSVGMIAGFTFVSWAPLSAVSRGGGGGMDVVALVTNLALVGSLLSTRNRYTVRGSNLMRASVYLGWLASLAVISGVYWGVSMLVLDVTWDQARTYSLGDPTSTIDNLQRLQLLATIAFFVACLAFLIRLLKSLRPDDVRLSVAATRDLLRRCGADSLDYFVTNEKKRHYIWRDGRGLIGYDLANGLVLASGNPICAPQHRATLLNDFLHDMERDGYVVAFWAIDQTLADDLGNRGFRTVKLGEEASLEVDRFSLENLGARGSALKRAVRSVEAHGIEFAFYRLEEVPGHVYSQMDDLDRSWLQEFGGTDEGLLDDAQPAAGLRGPGCGVRRSAGSLRPRAAAGGGVPQLRTGLQPKQLLARYDAAHPAGPKWHQRLSAGSHPSGHRLSRPRHGQLELCSPGGDRRGAVTSGSRRQRAASQPQEDVLHRLAVCLQRQVRPRLGAALRGVQGQT